MVPMSPHSNSKVYKSIPLPSPHSKFQKIKNPRMETYFKKSPKNHKKLPLIDLLSTPAAESGSTPTQNASTQPSTKHAIKSSKKPSLPAERIQRVMNFKTNYFSLPRNLLQTHFLVNQLNKPAKRQNQYHFSIAPYTSSYKTYRFGIAAFLLHKNNELVILTKNLCVKFDYFSGVLKAYHILPDKAKPQGMNFFSISLDEQLILMSKYSKDGKRGNKVKGAEKISVYDHRLNKVVYYRGVNDGLKFGSHIIFQKYVVAYKKVENQLRIHCFNLKKRRVVKTVQRIRPSQNVDLITLEKNMMLKITSTGAYLIDCKTLKTLAQFSKYKNYNFNQRKRYQGTTWKVVNPELFILRPQIFVRKLDSQQDSKYSAKLRGKLGSKYLVVGSSFVYNLHLYTRESYVSWRGKYLKDLNFLKLVKSSRFVDGDGREVSEEETMLWRLQRYLKEEREKERALEEERRVDEERAVGGGKAKARNAFAALMGGAKLQKSVKRSINVFDVLMRKQSKKAKNQNKGQFEVTGGVSSRGNGLKSAHNGSRVGSMSMGFNTAETIMEGSTAPQKAGKAMKSLERGNCTQFGSIQKVQSARTTLTSQNFGNSQGVVSELKPTFTSVIAHQNRFMSQQGGKQSAEFFRKPLPMRVSSGIEGVPQTHFQAPGPQIKHTQSQNLTPSSLFGASQASETDTEFSEMGNTQFLRGFDSGLGTEDDSQLSRLGATQFSHLQQEQEYQYQADEEPIFPQNSKHRNDIKSPSGKTKILLDSNFYAGGHEGAQGQHQAAPICADQQSVKDGKRRSPEMKDIRLKVITSPVYLNGFKEGLSVVIQAPNTNWYEYDPDLKETLFLGLGSRRKERAAWNKKATSNNEDLEKVIMAWERVKELLHKCSECGARRRGGKLTYGDVKDFEKKIELVRDLNGRVFSGEFRDWFGGLLKTWLRD